MDTYPRSPQRSLAGRLEASNGLRHARRVTTAHLKFRLRLGHSNMLSSLCQIYAQPHKNAIILEKTVLKI